MTWAEFKAAVDKTGVRDEEVIELMAVEDVEWDVPSPGRSWVFSVNTHDEVELPY